MLALPPLCQCRCGVLHAGCMAANPCLNGGSCVDLEEKRGEDEQAEDDEDGPVDGQPGEPVESVSDKDDEEVGQEADDEVDGGGLVPVTADPAIRADDVPHTAVGDGEAYDAVEDGAKNPQKEAACPEDPSFGLCVGEGIVLQGGAAVLLVQHRHHQDRRGREADVVKVVD